QVTATKGLSDPLLHVVLGGATVTDATADLTEGGFHDGINGVASGEVAGDLFFSPGSLKTGDQVPGADNFLAEAAHQLHCAGIHQSDIGNEVFGRVLHGYGLVRIQHGLELVPQFTPGGVFALAAGEGVKMSGFNTVDQLDRIAFAGNQIEP